MKINVTNISWDTDGKEVVGLPIERELVIQDFCGGVIEADYKSRLGYTDEFSSHVADKLSDMYGYCVNDFTIDLLDWC